MTLDEAKLLLGCFRPDVDDPADPLFADAFSLLAAEPELAAWFEKEKSFDRDMREALREIRPPADLRDALLGENKVIRPFSFRPYAPLLAIAAILVALVAVGGLFRPSSVTDDDAALAALVRKIPEMTVAHSHSMASGGNFAPIRSWLAEHGGISDMTIPEGLKNAAGIACEVTEIEGRKVTILCFDRKNHQPVHLYVMQASPSSPEQGPSFFEVDGVAVATWRDKDLVYFLAGKGPINSIRPLFAFRNPPPKANTVASGEVLPPSLFQSLLARL